MFTKNVNILYIKTWFRTMKKESGGRKDRSVRTVFHILQNIARLAVQRFADGFERAETDGFGFARFEDGEVRERDVDLFGKFVERHFAPGHHHIKVYDYGHGYTVSSFSDWIAMPRRKICANTRSTMPIKNHTSAPSMPSLRSSGRTTFSWVRWST